MRIFFPSLAVDDTYLTPGLADQTLLVPEACTLPFVVNQKGPALTRKTGALSMVVPSPVLKEAIGS